MHPNYGIGHSYNHWCSRTCDHLYRIISNLGYSLTILFLSYHKERSAKMIRNAPLEIVFCEPTKDFRGHIHFDSTTFRIKLIFHFKNHFRKLYSRTIFRHSERSFEKFLVLITNKLIARVQGHQNILLGILNKCFNSLKGKIWITTPTTQF